MYMLRNMCDPYPHVSPVQMYDRTFQRLRGPGLRVHVMSHTYAWTRVACGRTYGSMAHTHGSPRRKAPPRNTSGPHLIPTSTSMDHTPIRTSMHTRCVWMGVQQVHQSHNRTPYSWEYSSKLDVWGSRMYGNRTLRHTCRPYGASHTCRPHYLCTSMRVGV